MHKFFNVIVLGCTLALSTSAQALIAQQIVMKQVTTLDENGDPQTQLVDASLVTPGETIVYQLRFENDQPEAANDLVLTMPVPEQVIYQNGSASYPGAAVTYSADGGETFYKWGEVKFQTETGQDIIAQAEDITHIRWYLADPVAPGEIGVLSFAATLR